jgi:hypothetical protein
MGCTVPDMSLPAAVRCLMVGCAIASGCAPKSASGPLLPGLSPALAEALRKAENPPVTERTVSSRWAPSVTIDGRAEEWEDESLELIDDAKVALGIGNDSRNLYLVITSRDPRAALGLGRHGARLWISAGRARRKDVGLCVSSVQQPGGGGATASQPASGTTAASRPASRQVAASRPASLATSLSMMKEDAVYPIPAAWEHPPAAAIACVNGICTLEVKLRLGTWGDSVSLSADAGKTIGIGIELSLAVPRRDVGAGAARGPGMSRRGMGRGGGRRGRSRTGGFGGGGFGGPSTAQVGPMSGGGGRAHRGPRWVRKEIWAWISLAEAPPSTRPHVE